MRKQSIFNREIKLSWLTRPAIALAIVLVVYWFSEGDDSTGILTVLILVGLYFLPFIVALRREHHQQGAIAVINVFLGWTLIGWVIALAMAFSAVQPPSVSKQE